MCERVLPACIILTDCYSNQNKHCKYLQFLCSGVFLCLLSFMDGGSESEEYDDSDSESEDPFTSHQARRQASSGSQRGAVTPFYNYPGAGWTPPFSSAPPLPWVTQTLRHTDRQTGRQTEQNWHQTCFCSCRLLHTQKTHTDSDHSAQTHTRLFKSELL